MTQEEKQLLLQDLCARLPYGVIINCIDPNFSGSTDEKLYSINWLEQTVISGEWTDEYNIDNIKPYLRPMSSMTKKEYKEYDEFEFISASHFAHGIEAGELIDWLNAHHFDYHRLIEKGLALEAPEGMYSDNYEDLT